MLGRTLFAVFILSLPFQATAAGYIVHPGDTLNGIAGRFHVSVRDLARVNGITNINLVTIGRNLLIPVPRRMYWYRVRWGDTLYGIASQARLDLATIRSLNPRLGAYPLAGQWLRLCGPCSTGSSYTIRASVSTPQATPASSVAHIVQPGETLVAIAGRYGVTVSSLLTLNRLTNPNHILIGTRLAVPTSAPATYDPSVARSAIVAYAQRYGLSPALPLAIGWQESGFNQGVVSRTGAIGVMQVEPYTGQHIARLVGRSFNLYQLDDNVHAGVYWLSQLVSYYGGNETMAVAAYYEGTRALARHGFYQDTVQYVRNVMSLKASFGG